MSWTTAAAVQLCRQIEDISPEFGCHVALTGGLLYKGGERKDADILLYRIRQRDSIDVAGLFKALKEKLGIEPVSDHGWVQKAKYQNRNIDFLFPEEQAGDYPEEHEAELPQVKEQIAVGSDYDPFAD